MLATIPNDQQIVLACRWD